MQEYHYGRDRWYKADEVDAELNVLKTEFGNISKQVTDELAIKNGEINALSMQNEVLAAKLAQAEEKLVQANAIIAKVKEALGNTSDPGV